METAKKETESGKVEETNGQKDLFELPVKVSEPKKEAAKMTIAQATESGWSAQEIKMGQEAGMLTEAKEEGSEDEGSKKEPGIPAKEEKAPIPEEKPKDQKKTSSIEDFLLDDAEEKRLSQAFDKDSEAPKKLKNVSANYWGRKHAIARAQAAEAERDQMRRSNEELMERLASIEEQMKTVNEKPEGEEEDERPLTKKEMLGIFKTMREDEANMKKTHQEQTQKKQEKISNALKIQDGHARDVYSDYDKTVTLGADLIRRDENGTFTSPINLTTLPESARKKVVRLVREIQANAIRADEMTIDDYTVADMSYDLGKIALENGAKLETEKADPKTDSDNAERTPRGLTPEDEERIRKNQSRTGSSASISGTGGRRVVSASEVTIEELNSMDSKTFEAFQKNHPERVEELMRG